MWAVLLFNSTNHGVLTINGRAAGRCLLRSAYRQHQQLTNVRFIEDKGQAFSQCGELQASAIVVIGL